MDTKALRQRILDLAIHGKLVPQDPNDEPAAVLLKRINPKAEISSDNELYGKVPEGWCVVKVKDVFVINPKNKIDEDIDAGFVPMTNISDGFLNQFSYEKKKWKSIKSGFTHFADGDIAVAKISPCLENRKSMVLDNLPNGIGAGTTELHVFRPLLCLTQLYGLYFFKSDYFINQCVGTFNGVVGQQRIGKSIVEDISIPLPPLPEQHRIVSKIESLFSLISLIETGKSNLQTAVKQAKSKILDLAIHGKLVPHDPNDEPAAELLKRINPKAEISSDNELYGKVPEGWCVVKVKDVFVINPKNKIDEDIDAGFVPMTNISDGFLNQFSYEKKKWKSIKSGFTHFADGDIAVAKISPCLENRKSMVLDNLPNGIGAGTTELHVFRPLLCLTQLYGLYFFKSDYFINQCVGTFNGVVGQQRIGKSIVEDISIPVPPLPEQHRIVAKIESLFSQLDLIEASL